jgi:hypothetical protein
LRVDLEKDPILGRKIGLRRALQRSGLARRSGNDFEAPVTRNLPGIGALLLALRQAGARGDFGTTEMIQMSGSGSTLFIVTEGGQPVPGDFGADAGVRLISTTNAMFVEPVVLTH